MKVKVLSEHGYCEALLGLGLAHGLTSAFMVEGAGEIEFPSDIAERLARLAIKLAACAGGHNKFLESITVWLDITGPRYWWSQFDTYRVGVTKQSESTMHTLGKRELTAHDFEDALLPAVLTALNAAIDAQAGTVVLKANLPESFLQRRIVCTNYKTLRNIVAQRQRHRLAQWQQFCIALKLQLAWPDLCFEKNS